ncbi:GNAT family N-acetyltransferase [Mesorhizobium amorphae]|uniref:GNAT family N-acetyltransferase n=1 Tax=Mesorhizobium amorphae TaxID=71433 RepID=UPI003D111D96
MRTSYDPAVLDAALPLITRANPALLSAGTYYLAVDDIDIAVGGGGWSWERPGSSEVTPGLAHIRHFATRPEWLGRGVGSALYGRCEEDARWSGAPFRMPRKPQRGGVLFGVGLQVDGADRSAHRPWADVALHPDGTSHLTAKGTVTPPAGSTGQNLPDGDRGSRDRAR